MSNPSLNPPSTQALSVSELNRQARTLLERSFLTIQVEGEISNFVRPSSGHWYFTLKDDKAQVRCAMFRNRNAQLNQPKNGDRVLIRAKVSLYEGRGDFQLICEGLQPAGSGSLQIAFDALKLKLQQEGLFDSQHKKPLPLHPRHLGIITSPSGAAVHDILTVLKRRFPGMPVTLYPSAVQGEDAPAQLCRAILLAEAHQTCDVLILGRGGGSLEDLWAFNNEQLARAVFECEIPIISAVGHEVDVVITDFVADTRAPTPSAAAELISPDQAQLRLRLSQMENRLQRQINLVLKQGQNRISHLRSRLREPGQRLKEQAQRLDNLEFRLGNALQQRLRQLNNRQQQLATRLQAQSPRRNLERQHNTVQTLEQRLKHANQQRLQQLQFQLRSAMQRLHSVSPLATLERGYAITKDADGRIISDARTQQPGNLIETQLHQGRLLCSVQEIITESIE
ncbi:exodeoxyribonuclease VII large subunit [Neptuniibacter halophilus]|uniref:exodeoxyribonuclease VII large subunit n=1 Tax=Neptuniibacter halophilus TaxID=651666 RepID=UPI003D9BAEBC